MPIDDLSRYVVDTLGCWLWAGPAYPNGYGKTAQVHDGTQLAHRVIYLASGRTIPDGLDLDHLCRVRLCVNPDHLEPVDRSTNLRRGGLARTVCRRGHDLTDPANTRIDGKGVRFCVPCWRLRYQAAGQRYRASRRTT